MPADDRAFARRLAAAYAALALPLAWLHEPWRDELGLWTAAGEHASLASFYAYVDYGGHPRLWHTAVWLLQRLGDDFRLDQLFQLGVAVAAAWVVARFAPLARPARAALVFGYYPLFEFGVIARPYGLGMLLAFSAFAVFCRRPRSPLALAVVLSLLAQISVFHVLLALALAVAFALELAREAGGARPDAARLAAAGAFFAAAVAISVVQMIPPADAPFAAGWRTDWRPDVAARVLGQVTAALLPLPPPRLDFWNRHLLDGAPAVRALLGGVLLAGLPWLLRDRLAALALWTSGSLAYLAFAYVKFALHARHYGVLFLLFVGALWLARADAEAPGGAPRDRLRALALAGVLALQLAAGLFAAGADLAAPFSAGPDAARFLRAAAPANEAVVADVRFKTHHLRSLVPQPLVFLETGSRAPNTLAAARPADALAAARELAAARGAPALLLLSYDLEPPPPDATLVAAFDRSIARERYWIYRVAPPSP